MTIRVSLLSAALWFGAGVAPGLAGHRCHVYVVDVQRALSLAQRLEDGVLPDDQYEQQLALSETRFDEFEPVVREEQLTTKHYQMPHDGNQITASVFYTDEALGIVGEDFALDSVSLSVVVSAIRHENASSVPGNAIIETGFSEFSVLARVKQFVMSAGLEFLVGMECQFAESYDSLYRALGLRTTDDAPESTNSLNGSPAEPPSRKP
jgi:hypothetical protein